jgi:hypothetical protein
VNDDDPSYFEAHGKYSWDVEEDVGYTEVILQLESGGSAKSRIFGREHYTRPAKIQKLQMLHMLVNYIRDWCIAHQDLELSQYQHLIDSYNRFVAHKYSENTDVSITPEFVREGIRIFAKTLHTIQELDPNSDKFQAVNKPKNVTYYEHEPVHGRDRKLRSYKRHIVIKLASRGECYLQRLMIHELAHTPANHLCFRHDDHDADFRIFQALFTEIAMRGGFFSENGRFSGYTMRTIATRML